VPTFEFRKASRSNAERERVEVATNVPQAVAVRDSKDAGGPALTFAPTAWSAFPTALGMGEFPR
jgi:Domain of unknown function (DUF397)